MSVADGAGLQARYREALALGEELLRVLDGPVPDMDRVTHLVGQRETAAAGAQALIDSGGDPAPFREDLQALLAQQEQLQAALQAAMTALQARHAASRMQQRNLQDVRRLLNAGPRSGHLNERR